MSSVNTILKAVYAGVTAALGAIGTALVQAHTFGNIDDATWITVAIVTVTAFGAVYGVTNQAGGASGTPPGP